MAARFNLSCNDLKFRWKIEPIRKEEEKLKVLIEGEESALQRLLAQRECSAPSNSDEAPVHHCATGDATNVNDTTDGNKTMQKIEDSRQEIVLKLRCERRRKKLAEMHSRKLEILWDFVKEWVKLEVDRLSAENFLKKHPAVKKLAKYYIKYPRDILLEEESWERIEDIMTQKAAELHEIKESEDIDAEKTRQQWPQFETTTNMVQTTIRQMQVNVGQTDAEIDETETAPIQESASLFVEEPDPSEMQYLSGEDYLNEVTKASCPWQHDSAARADWEFAKALQLAPHSFESSSHTTKAFLDEPQKNFKPTETNDNRAKGQTSSKNNANNIRRGHEATVPKKCNIGSGLCGNASSRRGRGGYMKQHLKKNTAQTATHVDNSVSTPSPVHHKYGKSVKTYAKAVTESKPSVTVPLRKKGGHTLSKAKSEQKPAGKHIITFEPKSGSCKVKGGNAQRLTKDESSYEHTANSNSNKQSDEIGHTPQHTKNNSPNKSDKRSRINSATSPYKNQKIRRSSHTKVESGKGLINKTTDSDTTTPNRQVEQTSSCSKRHRERRDTKRNKSLESAEGIHPSPQSDVASVGQEKDRSDDTSSKLARAESPSVNSAQTPGQDTAESRKDVSTSPSPTTEPRIIFIGIDKDDDINLTDEQRQYLCQPTTDSWSEYDNGKSSCEADTKSTNNQVIQSPNSQDINMPTNVTSNTEDQDNENPVIHIPPLDLSGLSNRSEDDSPPEPRTVSFIGDTYDSSIIIGDSSEPIKDDVRVPNPLGPPSPLGRSGTNQNASEAHDSSVFNFFFQGHSTANILPDGFPQFNTPRDERYNSTFSPSHCPMKAGDFKPFQNSWHGGLPGTSFPTLSPGRIDGYPNIWSNYPNPQSTSDGWSHNEEASNHLKRMLRISTSQPSCANPVEASLLERGTLVENNPAQNYAQFLDNGVNDTNDRGDPRVMRNKGFDSTTSIHDPFHSNLASNSASNFTPPTFQEKVPYPDEVPRRLRKSDSDEDFGTFFPSSSIFDSTFGI